MNGVIKQMKKNDRTDGALLIVEGHSYTDSCLNPLHKDSCLVGIHTLSPI